MGLKPILRRLKTAPEYTLITILTIAIAIAITPNDASQFVDYLWTN